MEPNEDSRALPEVGDVVRRHGHSGGVDIPGSPGEPRDVVRPRRPDSAPEPPSTSEEEVRSGATRRPRRRTPGRHGRAVGLLVLVGAGIAWFGSGSSSSGSMTLPSNQVEVTLQGVGDLRIRTGSSAGLGWSATSALTDTCRAIPRDPAPGEPLRVDVTCEPRLGDGDVELEVPSTTRLTVVAGDTDVRAAGQLTALSVTTGSGDVRVDDFTGDVAVRVQDGDVRLDEVAGAIWVDAGADVRADVSDSRDVRVRSREGDVRLDYRGQVATTTVDAARDVRIELASGPARLDLQSRRGDVDTSLESTPGAAQSVTVRTDGGDIDVDD